MSRSLAMGNDDRLGRESIVSERVIAVIVGVDQVEDRLLRHPTDSVLDLLRHISVDVGVDDKDSELANDEPTVIDSRVIREQSVDAVSERLGYERDAFRMDRWWDTARRAVQTQGVLLRQRRQDQRDENHCCDSCFQFHFPISFNA